MDAVARRRAQTRLNTRAYRKRKALAAATAGTLIKSEELPHTLISGILATPLDYANKEIIYIIPYAPNPFPLPPTVLPTTLQQTVPHSDWINLFPCPEGRDRLIQGVGAFEEDELWAECIGGLFEGFPDDEIKRPGIVAWSPPWDIAGWEISEGFVRKWGWLFRGLEGPLGPTNRWRRERGEEPIVYEDCISLTTV
ncbi:hypothetical protein BDW59DRAFT_165686 [Aspergillus cavernicola]|uniref:BZIP domain-containing protein n=1 Tax=Aspergillus cavernicola TaxID=176166 RepID=A0ABR4HRI2_9EURO